MGEKRCCRVNRILLYLVLGVVGLGVAVFVLLYVSFQLAKLLLVGVLVLAVLLVGKRMLTRNRNEPLPSNDDRRGLPERERGRQRVRHR